MANKESILQARPVCEICRDFGYYKKSHFVVEIDAHTKAVCEKHYKILKGIQDHE